MLNRERSSLMPTTAGRRVADDGKGCGDLGRRGGLSRRATARAAW